MRTAIKKCRVCKTREAVVRRSRNQDVCRPCNRDQTYYYAWKRKVRLLGITVAQHEIENLQRRIKLIQAATRAELSERETTWAVGKSKKGRRPNALPKPEL